MKKRIISTLLCLVICLSLLPTAGIVSAASSRGGDVILPPDTFPTAITKVELTVEAPTDGKLYSDSLMVPTLKTTPANAADVIVENLCWYNTDGNYFKGIFEADTVYAYEIYLKPKDGYCFMFDGDDYKGTILANGSAPKYTECAGLAHDILEVSVLVTCKPDDSDFTITFDPNGGTGSMESATFSKGDIYTLPETCGFTAPEGMEFGGAWEVSCWETTRSAGTTWHFDQFEKATVIKPVWVKKDRAEITKVELSGLTAPVAGKTAAECSVAPAISTTPAAAAEYVVDSVRWFSSDWAYFDGTFAPGQTYFCEVCLRAAEDYKFSKDDDWNYTGEVMINGANEYSYAEPNAEGTLLYVCKGFTLEKEDITEIELTIGTPTVGKTAAECMLVPEFTTTPADAAEFKVEYSGWYNGIGIGAFTGTFEAGKEYVYEIGLVPKDGYKFPGVSGDYQGTVLVNGKEALYAEACADGRYALIGVALSPDEASFTDITEIELTIGAPTVGKTAADCMFVPEFTTTPTDAADFKLEYSAWYNRNGSGQFTGTFEAGREYLYEVCLVAKDGYTFPGNGDFAGTTLVNGKEPLYVELSSKKDYVLIGIVMTPVEKITKVEVTVEAPTAGKTPAESLMIPKYSMTPAGAAELIETSLCWYNLDGSYFTGTFEAGKQYAYYMCFKPKAGYMFEFADGEYAGAVVPTGGTLQYTESEGYANDILSVSIIVECKAAELPFTDVTEKDWSYKDIAYAYEKGLMNGTSETTFDPQVTTSRAMIVTILYRLESSPVINYPMTFTDVESGTWYTEAIRWAQSTGVVNGVSPTEFAPDAPITREQMAAILYRYAGYKKYDVSQKADLSKYTDAGSISDYAKDAIAWANATGLINGMTATTIYPEGNATREQVAAILHRFCENIV